MLGAGNLDKLPLFAKKAVLVCGDLVLVPLSLWLAASLRLGRMYTRLDESFLLFAGLAVFTVVAFERLGLYRAMMRYVGIKALEQIALGALFSTAILLALMLMQGTPTIPRSSFAIYPFVAFVLVGGSRYLARRVMGKSVDYRGDRVAIYGAGAAGTQLVQLLHNSKDYRPVVFLDDNSILWGREIDGLAVLDPSADDLVERLEKLRVSDIFLSLPSATRSQRLSIIERMEQWPFRVLTVPGVEDMLAGGARLDEIREVAIEDLLGRDSVPPRVDLLDRCIRDKTVLVTGAGGSIGSELCRQVLTHGPKRLLMLELSEFALYAIDQELQSASGALLPAYETIPLLGSVADSLRLEEIFKAFEIDTVYHAAAYKHVPLVEQNPAAGLINNVLGTRCLAQQAAASGVSHFVLISTDKAVRPTNIMGASKRLAEMVLQGLQKEHSNITFSMVRFGNVLGSSGSVVPLFRGQIAGGGPVTVTHEQITRFFMTVPEAVQLVIQAGAMAHGGDVFVLDMGEPVKIMELAKRLIHLSGLEVRDKDNPDGDIEIAVTGLRPGEKLYEELLIGDGVIGTEHPKIMRAEEHWIPWGELKEALGRLELLLQQQDLPAVRELLMKLVSGYKPHARIEDFVYQARNDDRQGKGGVVSLLPRG